MSSTFGTLPPTAARIRELRERGDIARSRDAVAGAALAGAVAGLFLSAGTTWENLVSLVERACQNPVAAEALPLARRGLEIAGRATAPVLAGAVAAALLAIAVQLGWPPILWPRARARARGAPADSPFALGQLRQMFGLTAMARRTALTVAKTAAVAGAIAFALSPRALEISTVPQLQRALVACCSTALVACTVVFLLLGFVDYGWAYYRLVRRRRMTPEEVRREARELEGDPAIRARRNRRRQELTRDRNRRAERVLDGATALVLAPGAIAVALRYRSFADPAPRVLLRVLGRGATRLAERAAALGIPTFERPELARALAELPEGSELPSALYRAAALVLAEVVDPRLAPRRPAGGARWP